VRRSASVAEPAGAGLVTGGSAAAGGLGGGTAGADGWGEAPCFWPHFGQNAKSGGQAKPQLAQAVGWRAPHFGQNEKSA